MIKKLKIGLLVAVLSLAVGVSSAYAINLTYSDYQDISLGSYTLTIHPTSYATSLVVTGTTSIDVLVPTSSTFTIASHNDIAVSASGGSDATSSTCTGVTNTLTIPGDDAITYTLTPGSGVCAANAGGGGGGGGGAYVPPAVVVPPVVVATTTPTTTTTPAVATTTTTYALGTTTLKNGSRGEAVKELQRFLNANLNLGLVVDGALGPKTIAVIKTWQGDNGLVVDGLVGPATKAMMNNTTTTPATPATPAAVSTGSYSLGTTTLRNGSRGDAVKELQRFLNANLNLGLVVDGIFGPNTTSVMKTWQADHDLVVDGLVGPNTKAMINAQ